MLTSPFHDWPHYATDSLHRKHHETGDELTELRQFNLSRRQERAPSQGAAPSTFRRDQASHPIQFGRPRDDHFYPLPICLLQPEFGTFQDDLRSVPLDPSLSPLGWEWVTKLSLLFEKESDREKALHKLLASLLGKDFVIEKMNIGKYQTDGGVRIPQPGFPNLLVVPVNIEVKNETTEGSADGVFENILYFREGVRVLLTGQYEGDWKKTRFPSILILHNGTFLAQLLTLLDLISHYFTGPNIQVLGAVYLAAEYVEVLSHSIPLYFNPYNTSAMADLLRFMTALRRLFQSIWKVYEHPTNHAVDETQVKFPYPRSYSVNVGAEDPHQTVSFDYIGRLSNIRLVFTARTKQGKYVIVKFGSGQYGANAHQAAVTAGLAPAILSYSHLPGGMWMVVMEPLEIDFKPCDEFNEISDSLMQAVMTSIDRFHALGYVHGDLRDSNVFVRERTGPSKDVTWECRLIDYDWAGREGDAIYPLGVYCNDAVWRPEKYMDGKPITTQSDRQMVDEFCKRRAMVSRF